MEHNFKSRCSTSVRRSVPKFNYSEQAEVTDFAETFEVILRIRLCKYIYVYTYIHMYIYMYANGSRSAYFYAHRFDPCITFRRLCKITVHQDKKTILCKIAGVEIRVTKHLSRVKLFRELGTPPGDKVSPFIGRV